MKVKCRLRKANGHWLNKMNKERRLVDNCSRIFACCPHGVGAAWLKRVMKQGRLFLVCEVVE